MGAGASSLPGGYAFKQYRKQLYCKVAEDLNRRHHQFLEELYVQQERLQAGCHEFCGDWLPDAGEQPGIEHEVRTEAREATLLFRPATEEEQLEKLLMLTGDDCCLVEELVLECAPSTFAECAEEETHTTVHGCKFYDGQETLHAHNQYLQMLGGHVAECVICFAELPNQQVCILIETVRSQAKTCGHYFHFSCARLLMQSSAVPYLCPLCRQPFETIKQVPDVRLDSAAWFNAVDIDGTGALNRHEVVGALSATLPVDPEMIERSLRGDLWLQWDPEGSGRISRGAFEHPGTGLLSFVLNSLPSLKKEVDANKSLTVLPGIHSSRENWFRFWDDSGQQSLQFIQLLRALVHTFRLEGAPEQASIVRSVLWNLWIEFGLAEQIESTDNGTHGRPSKQMSLRLFCEKPNGFGDELIAALKNAFGALYDRMLQKAKLLQLSPCKLKRELRRLTAVDTNIPDKEDLVDAILDAQAAGSRAQRAPTDPISTIRSLSISELKLQLKRLGAPYQRCVERRDLEDMLVQYRGLAGRTAV